MTIGESRILHLRNQARILKNSGLDNKTNNIKFNNIMREIEILIENK